MRFASHRDVARAVERGVRRAGVPVAYSAGFSPHPKISYVGGAPTGAASEAEYLEISLTQRCEPAEVGRALDAALPDGIDVIEVAEVDGKLATAQLAASEWEVVWPGVAAEAAARAAEAFLAAPSAEVERLTSKGVRRVDARAAVVSLSVERRGEAGTASECAILRMIVRQMTPAARPEDILAALRQASSLAPSAPPVVTRLWQGPLAEAAAGHGPAPAGSAEPGSGPAPSAGQTARPSTDKAMCLTSGSAMVASAAQARANEQLSRGTRDRLADPRAREPYGRDCPDARNRATESTT
ncbi:MAG: TIGR03936 family radical SAM-associated protein, partial [Streptosporangiaceae bacterium]